MFSTHSLTRILPALAAASFIGAAQAATIDWSAPQEIAGDSDVSTNGDGVLAFNVYDDNSNQSVNGVTFSNGSVVSSQANNYQYTENDVTVRSFGFDGAFSPFDGFGPPAGITGDYEALLETGAYTTNTGPTTITFTGLTEGQDYEVQIWVSDSRTVDTAARTLTLDGASPTQVAYTQYVIGTFTADGESQDISINGSSDGAVYNALQLRDVTIPEPGSMALLALGGLLLTRRRRA